MFQEWTQSTTVHAGGKIEVILPTLEAGERVEVTIRTVHSQDASGATVGDDEGRRARVRLALSELKARGVQGASIPDEAIRRESIYPDRT